MNKPKLNEPDVEISLTTPQGESISINKTIPNKQFEDYIENYIKPIEEEIIQEANKLGYEYLKDDFYIDLTRGTKRITIDIQELDYSCFDTELNVDLSINCEEHLLITKILTYLGGL